MSGYILSTASLSKLEGAHPLIVAVVRRAIEITPQDFSVNEGVRSAERQAALYAQGRTAPGKIVTWVRHSKHEKQADGFGYAVDLMPYPLSWADTPENLARFDAVGQAMILAAKELGTPIRWGHDWNMNGIPGERGETDRPHFELRAE